MKTATGEGKMMTEEYIAVWRDEDSDPERPVYCVSLCDDDGAEKRCLDCTPLSDHAIMVGKAEAASRHIECRIQF